MTLTQIKPAGLSKPVDLADNEYIRLGTGNDLQIYHDGNNSAINETGTGSLYIQGSNNIYLRDYDTAENHIVMTKDGSVDLYHNGSKKFETYQYGIKTTQNIEIGTHAYWGDNGEAIFGAGSDLKIYHDGTVNRIRSDVLTIIEKNDSEDIATFNPDGGVVLFYNGSNKIETTSGGVTVTGKIFADALDMGDDERVLLGTSDDLQVYHDGSNSYLKAVSAGTGDLYIFADGKTIYLRPKSGEDGIKVIPDGAVELYHDNVKKFETGSNYSVVTGVSNGNPAGLKITNSDANSNYSHAELRLISKNGASYGVIYNDHANSNVRIGHNTTGNTLEVFNDGVIRSQGIKFGSDTSSDNNLDDYEEGTWTPTVGSGGTINSTVSARYTKIGRMVHYQFYINMGSSSSTSSFSIGGLPYTAGNASQYFYGTGRVQNATFVTLQIDANSNGGLIYTSGGSTLKFNTASNNYVLLSGVYEAT